MGKKIKKILALLFIFVIILVGTPAYTIETKAADSDFVYTRGWGSGNVTITGYKGSSKAVVIPDNLGGGNVVTIKNDAFKNNNNIISVTIPEGVTSIGKNAFLDCKQLASVTMGEGISKIEESAFEGCTALQAVSLPESLTTIEKRAFAGCTSLKSIKLPSKLERIEEESFRGAGLQTVTIPSNVSWIGNKAFFGCNSMTWAKIEGSYTSLSNQYPFGFYDDANPKKINGFYMKCPDNSSSYGYANNHGFLKIGDWIAEGDRRKFLLTDGSYALNKWLLIDGKWYYFDKNEYMCTGWVKTNQKYCYCFTSGANIGAAAYGWQLIGGKWYYFGTDGYMKTGWVKLNNTNYYMDQNGAMVTGMVDVNGVKYYFDKNGAMQTGWIKYDNAWYYFGENGAMKTGWIDSGK